MMTYALIGFHLGNNAFGNCMECGRYQPLWALALRFFLALPLAIVFIAPVKSQALPYHLQVHT